MCCCCDGYDAIIAFVNWLVHIFFRDIKVTGEENIPDDGPVIFVGNHPNALLDPAVLLANVPRRVSVLAKSTLFSVPFLGWMISAAHAIPVFRSRDRKDKSKPTDHSAMFAAVHDAFADGNCIAIFPEGISHDETSLQELKPGVAVMALGGQAKLDRAATPIRIVACGLNYMVKDRFRSRVLVEYSPPLEVDAELAAQFEAQAADCPSPFRREATQTLMSHIEALMRAVTTNADDWETLEVIKLGRRLFVPPDQLLSVRQYLGVNRRFAEVYTEHRDQPEVADLFQRVSEYRADLMRLGLEDYQVRAENPTCCIPLFTTTYLILYMLILFPIALVGNIIHLPIILTARLSAAAHAKKEGNDVIATYKLMLAFFVTPLLYLAYDITAGLIANMWEVGLICAAALPILGWITIRVNEEWALVMTNLKANCGVINFQREIDELRQTRDGLVVDVRALVDTYASPEDRATDLYASTTADDQPTSSRLPLLRQESAALRP